VSHWFSCDTFLTAVMLCVFHCSSSADVLETYLCLMIMLFLCLTLTFVLSRGKVDISSLTQTLKYLIICAGVLTPNAGALTESSVHPCINRKV